MMVMARAGRQLLAAGVAAAAALAIAACSTSAGAKPAAAPRKLVPIVVGAVPSEGAAGLYIAQAKGLFTRAGLHVTIMTAQNSAIVIPAMLHDNVTANYGAYTAFLSADAIGAATLLVIAPGSALTPGIQQILVRPGSSIHSLADLTGKTIAVSDPDGLDRDLLSSQLAGAGVSLTQVGLADVPLPAMSAALAAGRVDAILATEPFVTEAVQQDHARSVADVGAGPDRGVSDSGYAVDSSWARQHPRLVAGLITALERGNAIAAADPAQVRRVMVSQLHMAPAVARAMAVGRFPAAVRPAQLQRVASLMLRYGQLAKSFPVGPIIGP
jgi:NitT/TauT family transport system substrate-binding protein